MRSAHSPRFGSSRAWPSSFADLRRLRHGSRPLGATKGDAHPTESAPPDRRRPRAFLDHRTNDRIGVAAGAVLAAGRGGLVRAVRIERIHAVRLAVARAPAAGRILEHAHVPEGRLSGVERRVGPQRAERRRAAPGGRARARLDGRAVVATSGDVVDRLVRRAAGVDPSLDDLDGLKVTAGGILQDRHREARRARLAGLREKAAHRHPARVTLLHESIRFAEVLRIVPSAEETDDRPRPARGIRLAAAQRLEDRVARVLFGPRDRETTGVVFDLAEELVRARGRRMRALKARLFGVSRRAEVRIGGADEAEPERVHAERLRATERETRLQDVADERALGEFRAERRFRSWEGKERAVRQQLEVAQLVRRAETGTALRRPLRLHDLDERFELRPQRGVLGACRIEELLAGAEIRVVRNDEHGAAAVLGQGSAVALETLSTEASPELSRVWPGVRLADRMRGDPVVSEDDVAVEVRAERRAGPLVADECCEVARRGAVVEFLGGVADRLPEIGIGALAVDAGKEAHRHRRLRRRQRIAVEPCAEQQIHVLGTDRRLSVAAVEDALRREVSRTLRIHADARLSEALRMIGDRGEVERARELRVQAVARGVARRDLDFVSECEEVRVARTERRIPGGGIERQTRMHVKVAEKRLTERNAAPAGLA